MPVLLDLGCCPAGSTPERVVRDRGGKAVVVAPVEPAGLRHDEQPDPDGWVGHVADLVGLHPQALAAGCPVPLAEHVLTWARVAQELDADRWDAVVVPAPGALAVALLEAPAVLLRTLDARLDALAGTVGDDAEAARRVAGLLVLRPRLRALADVAAGASLAGHTARHREHGCDRAVVGLGTVDPADPTAPPRPGLGVRTGDGDLLWWLEVPAGTLPDVHREEDRLLVRVGSAWRELALPPALTRCRATAATVVADRLEVRFTPDPDSWR